MFKFAKIVFAFVFDRLINKFTFACTHSRSIHQLVEEPEKNRKWREEQQKRLKVRDRKEEKNELKLYDQTKGESEAPHCQNEKFLLSLSFSLYHFKKFLFSF